MSSTTTNSDKSILKKIKHIINFLQHFKVCVQNKYLSQYSRTENKLSAL